MIWFKEENGEDVEMGEEDYGEWGWNAYGTCAIAPSPLPSALLGLHTFAHAFPPYQDTLLSCHPSNCCDVNTIRSPASNLIYQLVTEILF